MVETSSVEKILDAVGEDLSSKFKVQKTDDTFLFVCNSKKFEFKTMLKLLVRFTLCYDEMYAKLAGKPVNKKVVVILNCCRHHFNINFILA